MHSSVTRLVRLGLAMSVLLAVVAPAPGRAQKVDPPVGPGEFIESWALSPTGENPGQPSSRPNLTYSVAPGGSIEDAVTLWNYSSVPVSFRLLATDAFNNEAGDFSLLKTNETPIDLGAWISIGTTAITIPARTSATIPISLKVPTNASPGDHAAAVLAATDTVGVDSGGNEVNLDRRTGPRVYLRVTGPVNPELVLEDLSSKYQGNFNPFSGELEVEYTVRNPGNIRLGAEQRLVVKDILGRTVASRDLPRIGEILPGNAVTYRESISGVPATIRVKASIELKPFSPGGLGDQVPSTTSSSTNAWAIPWTLLLLIVLGYLLWRLYRRWRNAQDQDEEDEDAPPAGPTAPQRVPQPVGG